MLCPHFEPDTAPTGTVMTQLVLELAKRGHELHVVTALPWYRTHHIESGWSGRLVRREMTAFGSVTRVHPFPGGDRGNIARRAAGFLAFSALSGFEGMWAGWRSGGRRLDGVLVMSPPLPLGLIGWAIHLVRGGAVIVNVQDVFPDAAIESGAVTNRYIIGLTRGLERLTYRRSAAVTVLSDDLRGNVLAKLAPAHRAKVRVIPNFVDVDAIRPADRLTEYRSELGIGPELVVMYAGNVGMSQSLGLMLDAARSLPDVTFVINGDGSARPRLERAAADLANVRFGAFQPAERLAEVLATGDIHVVALRSGFGRVSVPSKTYSILAAGRPIVAAVDAGTEVPRIVGASGAGRAVPPDEPGPFVDAIAALVADPVAMARMGASGRAWVEAHVTAATVASAYEALVRERRDERESSGP